MDNKVINKTWQLHFRFWRSIQGRRSRIWLLPELSVYFVGGFNIDINWLRFGIVLTFSVKR